MIYLSILFALLGNSENPELNQTWIFINSDFKGWQTSSEKIDFLKIQNNSVLEFISIEKGIIRTENFKLNSENDMVLESGEIYGRIKSLSNDQLIIQHVYEKITIQNTYAPLPKCETTLSKEEMIQQIRNQVWQTEINPGKTIWSLGKSDEEDASIQFSSDTKRKKIIMPAELTTFENSWFLSYDLSNFFRNSDSITEKEHFIMYKMTADEIQLSLRHKDGLKIHSFRKKE